VGGAHPKKKQAACKLVSLRALLAPWTKAPAPPPLASGV